MFTLPGIFRDNQETNLWEALVGPAREQLKDVTVSGAKVNHFDGSLLKKEDFDPLAERLSLQNCSPLTEASATRPAPGSPAAS